MKIKNKYHTATHTEQAPLRDRPDPKATGPAAPFTINATRYRTNIVAKAGAAFAAVTEAFRA